MWKLQLKSGLWEGEFIFDDMEQLNIFMTTAIEHSQNDMYAVVEKAKKEGEE